jgi:hypothetical protein
MLEMIIKKQTKFSVNYKSDAWSNPETEDFFTFIANNWNEFKNFPSRTDFYNIYSAANCFERFYIKIKFGDPSFVDFKQIYYQYSQWRAGISTSLNCKFL